MVTVTYMNQSSCGRMPLQFLRMSRGPETKMLEDHYLRLIFWGDMDSGKSTLKKNSAMAYYHFGKGKTLCQWCAGTSIFTHCQGRLH